MVVVWKLFFLSKTEGFKNYYYQLLIIFGASAAFGMLIEVLQGVLTNYREPEWLDILANVTGALLACLFFILLKKPIKKFKARLI